MSRYVKYIIDQVRRETENEDSADFVGISDAEFIQYLNDAQYNIQSQIVALHPDVFVVEKDFSIAESDGDFLIPSDSFLGNKLIAVKYSSTGNDDDLYNLRETSLSRMQKTPNGDPAYYTVIRSGGVGRIKLTPSPSSVGKLKIYYVQRLRELDLRRGQVGAVTISTSTISALNIDLAKNSDIDSLNEHNHICIIDEEGNKKAENIKIDSINSSTGAITVNSSFALASSETIAVGDYIVGGKYTTTAPDIDPSVERYLIAYCAWKILKRDSSIDSTEAAQELSMMAQDIIKSYSLISEDVQYIPEINESEDWLI